MPRLINSRKTQIPVLPHFAEFFSVDDERCIISSGKLCAMSVIEGEGDGLPAEPVAGEVGIAVVEGDADGVVEDHFEVGNEVGVGEIATLLERVGDVLANCGSGGIVEVDAEGILDVGEVEVFGEIVWRGGVCERVADTGDFCKWELKTWGRVAYS